jgi:hypothetical protein
VIFILFTAFPVKAYLTRPGPPACRLPPTPGHEDRQVKADVLITAVERIFMSRFPSSMPPAKKLYFVISLCITVLSRLYSQEPSLLTCQAQPNRVRGRKAATSSEKQRLVPFISVYGIKRDGGAVLIVSEKDKLRLFPFISVTGIKRMEEQS